MQIEIDMNALKNEIAPQKNTRRTQFIPPIANAGAASMAVCINPTLTFTFEVADNLILQDYAYLLPFVKGSHHISKFPKGKRT